VIAVVAKVLLVLASAFLPQCEAVEAFVPCVYVSRAPYVEGTRPGDFVYVGGVGPGAFWMTSTQAGEWIDPSRVTVPTTNPPGRNPDVDVERAGPREPFATPTP